MAWRLLTLVCYQAAIFLVVPIHGDKCVLDKVLTEVEQWETQVSYIGKMKASFIRFHGEYMNQTTYGPLGEDEIQRECVASYADNKYVYKWKDGTSTNYRCYQLTPISKNVVIMKISEITSDVKAARDLCSADETSLRYVDWPLISTRSSGSESNECGIEGGFDFYVRLNGMEYCQEPSNSLRPRLEVGCSRKPGLHFDFRNNFNCRGFLDMTLRQSLTCLGSWRRGPYRFSVVTDNAELWPKIWLLRFPARLPVGASFEMLILPDIRMDMSTNPIRVEMPYVHSLVMKRSEISSVCEDEAAAKTCANICSGEYDADDVQMDDLHCQKSCHKCPLDQGSCVFPKKTNGEWLAYGNAGNRRVALTASLMYVDGLPPMKCLNLTGSVERHQPLVSFHSDGCKPDYRCVYLHPRGPNIIQYDISKPLQWPYKNNLTSADVCDAAHFTNPSTPYQLPDPSILIRTVGKRPVDCKIRGTFRFIGRRYKSNGKADCSGIITSCDFKDVFRIEYTTSRCSEPSQTYQCIASFDDGPSRILITEGEDGMGRLNQCWLMHRFKGDLHTTVYQVPLSNCHVPRPSTDRRQENGDYVMMYNVSAELELRDERSCRDYVQTTSRTEPTVTKTNVPVSSSERWMDLVTQHIPPNTPTTQKPYNISDMFLKASSSADYSKPAIAILVFLFLFLALS